MSESPRTDALLAIIVAAVIGIAAGMAGALLVAAYVLPPPVPEIGLGDARRVAQDSGDSAIAFRSAAQAVIRIFEGAGTATVAGTVWNPNQLLSAGVILTADGWVVTDRGNVADRLAAPNSLRVVTEGGEALTVERVVDAPTIGLAFLKTSGRDLPVAVFGDSRRLEPGMRLFAPAERAGGFVPLSLVNVASRDAEAPLAEGSADFRRRLALSGALPRNFAAPILTTDGQVVGLLFHPTKGSESALRAQPVEVVRIALSEVLVSGKTVFGDVGISGIPFAMVTAPTNDNKSGLVVSEVRRGSSAAAAGVQVGDIIRAIGSDAIDGRAPFAERFAGYAHGADMELLILRNGQEQRVLLTRP